MTHLIEVENPKGSADLPVSPPVQGPEWLLAELLAEFHKHRWRLLAVFVCSGLLGLGVSYLFDTKYRSVATLRVVGSEETSGLGALAGRFAGLAGLPGVSLGSKVVDTVAKTLATLESRHFLVQFARRNELTPVLFVNRFDSDSGTWNIKETLWFQRGEPTDEQIYKEMRAAVGVTQDPESGLVTLTVIAPSPREAQTWGRQLIQNLNDEIRVRDVEEAKRGIDYLRQQIATTSVSELQQVFYRLIEERTKVVMLAEIRPEYALETIDPPSLPEDPYQPKRLTATLLASVLGSVVFVCWMLLRFALQPYFDQVKVRGAQ